MPKRFSAIEPAKLATIERPSSRAELKQTLGQQKIAEANAKVWLHNNAHALSDSNTWLEQNGLPLDRLRLF